MKDVKVLTGSEAAAIAVAAARPEVISAYPITPQTGVIEKLSELVASGELKNCQFVPVESEHSALALLVGSAQAGARCFTATSSHGLVYMHEVMHWAAGARLPIVMVNVNRSLGSPWNIASDRTDSLSQRDTGWIQLYASSNQEVYDLVLQAFVIAERTCLPVMVNFDGFLLSHTKEPVTIASQKSIDQFAVKRRIPHALDNNDPRSIGAWGTAEYYNRIKYAFANDVATVAKTMSDVGSEFGENFQRTYAPIETYRMDDADVAVVIMGSTSRIVEEAVDLMHLRGVKVGAITLRLFRPFPAQELRSSVGSAKRIIAIDVNQHGIILDEVKSALYGKILPVFGFTVGVGGVPLNEHVFTEIIEEANSATIPDEMSSQWRGLPAPSLRQMSVPALSPAAEIKSSSEFLSPGHRACAGCTASLVMRHVLDAVGKKAQIVLPASCWSIIAGPNPYTPVRVPLVHCPFETAAAIASGLKRAAVELDRDITSIAFAGDGGTFDIGLQALSGAAERGEDIIYICYDNEAYMNTGGQRSSATPCGAITETTPLPRTKTQAKKNMLKIIAAHGVPYAATASIYHLEDFRMKLAKAVAAKGEGLRFIHVLAPCNPGWKIDPRDSLKMSYLAVETRMFPLVECDHGKWKITYRPEGRATLAEYITPQGRFAHFTEEDIVRMKEAVDHYWEELEKLEKYF